MLCSLSIKNLRKFIEVCEDDVVFLVNIVIGVGFDGRGGGWEPRFKLFHGWLKRRVCAGVSV